MKIKQISRIIVTILMTGLMLTACEKKSDNTESEKVENTTEVSTDTADNKTQEESGSENITDEVVDKAADSDSMEKYEALLAGSEKVGISRVNLDSYSSEGDESFLDKSKSYTMEEILDGFFKDRLSCFDNSYYVDELEYAYIDCGKDGQQELVLHFTSYIQTDEYSNIMVIKDISGKLELCYFTEEGYRSYNYVNQDGVIASGGSGGASVWYDSYRTIDSEGNVDFIYESESMGAYNIYVDGEDYGEVAQKMGIADELSAIRYSFEAYDSREYDEDSYHAFLEKSFYTYEKYDENWTPTHPAEIYETTSPFYKFMNLISNNVHSYDDMEKIIENHLEEKGLTRKELEENAPDWKKWEGHEALFQSTHVAAEVIVVENPSWEYYVTDYPYQINVDDFVTLSEISHEDNDIIDDDDWFNEIGIDKPVDGEINDPNCMYSYKLSSQYGEYYHQYDTVTIHNNYSNRDETILDFKNFTIPDECAVGDESFVRECVNYIQIVDGIAYVSITHRTYASSAPHNAYVMALDTNNNYKVIWKSEPLVCNSVNFAIVDGSIICGYGFTNEPDYIYELNRYTGEKMETIKVKSGPDYFYAIDGKLYVRTYNTNYVYQISWG